MHHDIIYKNDQKDAPV